ncbi:MAG: hypothetical protein AAFQ09_12770, partial [Pseudomonadota bacterium]
MKMLPKNAQTKKGKVTKHGYKDAATGGHYRDDTIVQRPKKNRKSKSFGRKVMSGLWDVVEDQIAYPPRQAVSGGEDCFSRTPHQQYLRPHPKALT